MGPNIKKAFTPAFKAKIALEAVKGVETTGQLASRFSVHPIQIGFWKKKLLEGLERIFSDCEKRDKQKDREFVDELYKNLTPHQIVLTHLDKSEEAIYPKSVWIIKAVVLTIYSPGDFGGL